MTQIDILLDRWQDGDQRAAEAIYDQYSHSVYRLACGLLLDAADAEEVMQDALLYALKNSDRFDPGRASFKTWLNRITVSRCRDKRRRKWLPQFSLSVWREKGGDVADERPLPEQTAMAQHEHDYLWQAMQELSPKLREVVLLRFWAGHTYREIAEIVDCPLPTAQSRAQFAYKKLRGALLVEELPNLAQETA
jgi:RNA polymerase sigma-70 factor (ECF subfamily)